jgi:hypothetical protein
MTVHRSPRSLIGFATVVVIAAGCASGVASSHGGSPPVEARAAGAAGAPPVVRGGKVVARGSSPVAGRWRLEAYRHRGLPCIRLTLLAPPPTAPTASGQCGRFARAPGFGYAETRISDGKGRAEHLIFGRAPKRAAFVRMTAPGGLRRVVPTHLGPKGTRSDFWLIVAPPIHAEATLRWRAADHSTAGKPLHVPATHRWEYP